MEGERGPGGREKRVRGGAGSVSSAWTLWCVITPPLHSPTDRHVSSPCVSASTDHQKSGVSPARSGNSLQ